MPEREPDITRVLDAEQAKCANGSNIFTSSDQYLVSALMMKNFYPYKAGYFTDSHNMMIYWIETPELEAFVGDILSGKANILTFTFSDSWRAQQTWIMLLRYFQNAAKNL
jgi:hypothetical protein